MTEEQKQIASLIAQVRCLKERVLIKYLVTYEINGDRDTDTIYICAHGLQMVQDIMKHYIVRDVIEKGEI